ncbi:MAG: cytidylate kinase-like family protein [Prevotella sp.]|uniref:cytidylate kinase-like family protein n=1 Tax=Prevotella sp. PTAC TaxID=2736295 RepID=UPI00155349BD|nr:cytidylate kinase-like family protein [Prevotella sp. PTAC]MCX4293837.1 cytidylate kinase-like family protein [Prevotella sp.]NPD55295.1 cytidylate kinase-like family protein [Prevotella sp. PTAC]
MIINVGRQLGSGGRTIASRLAERFNCRFYDRELLNLAAKESGFCEEFFERNDENKNFFKTIFHLHVPHMSDGNFYNNNLSQESLFKFQSDAIRKAAESGACVFVGRCADYVLRDRTDVVNIFVTANTEDRINRICGRDGLDEAEARKRISKGDSERASYYNYYTGKKWGHSESYDLCVNSSVLGMSGTVDYISRFIEHALATELGVSAR